MRVQVPEEHHPLGGEPRPDVAVALGNLVQDAARRGQRLPGDGVEILQPDRDPAECRGIAARRAARRRGCGGPRVLLVDADPGVDGRRIAVVAVHAVALGDPREARVDELAGGERARRECRGRFLDSEIRRVARHGAMLAGSTAERQPAYVSARHAFVSAVRS